MTTPSSRARGCLFGQIAGDNLGALVEFRPASAIVAAYPEKQPAIPAGQRRLLEHPRGQLPDDFSEMAFALARTCVEAGGYNQVRPRGLCRLGALAPLSDLGGTTRAALHALERGLPRSTGSSQANGALMRVSPLGILFAGSPQGAADAAEENALLTHPHPVTVACNRAYAGAIAVLVGGGTTDQAFDIAVDLIDDGDPFGDRTALSARCSTPSPTPPPASCPPTTSTRWAGC